MGTCQGLVESKWKEIERGPNAVEGKQHNILHFPGIFIKFSSCLTSRICNLILRGRVVAYYLRITTFDCHPVFVNSRAFFLPFAFFSYSQTCPWRQLDATVTCPGLLGGTRLRNPVGALTCAASSASKYFDGRLYASSIKQASSIFGAVQDKGNLLRPIINFIKLEFGRWNPEKTQTQEIEIR